MKKTISLILSLLLILPLLPALPLGVSAGETITVTMTGYDPDQKLPTVKFVREVTGMGLKDAKTFVENLPGVLARDLTPAEFRALAEKIAEADLGITYTTDGGSVPVGARVTKYGLTLIGYTCTKLQAISALRNTLGMGLGDANTLVSSLPVLVMEQSSYEACASAKETLELSGLNLLLFADPLTEDPLIGCGAGWYSYAPAYAEPAALRRPVQYDPADTLMLGEYANGFVYGVNADHDLVLAPCADGNLGCFRPLTTYNSEDLHHIFNMAALAYDPIGCEMFTAEFVRDPSSGEFLDKTDICTVELNGNGFNTVGRLDGISLDDLTFDGFGNVYGLADDTIYLLDLENMTYRQLGAKSIAFGHIVSITADVNTGELFCDFSFYYRDTVEDITEKDPDFYLHYDYLCLVDPFSGELAVVSDWTFGDIFGIPVLTSTSRLPAETACEWIGGCTLGEAFRMNEPAEEVVSASYDVEFMDTAYFDGFVYGVGFDTSDGTACLARARYDHINSPELAPAEILAKFTGSLTPISIAYDPATGSLYVLGNDNTLYAVGFNTLERSAELTKIRQFSCGEDLTTITFSNFGSFYAASLRTVFVLDPWTGELLTAAPIDVPGGEIADIAAAPDTTEIFLSVRVDKDPYLACEEYAYDWFDGIYRLHEPGARLSLVRFVHGSNFPYLNLTPVTDTFPLWVGGVRVTEQNCADIFGDGTASYDRENGTLTLKAAAITDTATLPIENRGFLWNVTAAVVFNEPLATLTIMLEGDCLISAKPETGNEDLYGIWSAGSLQIVGENGTLTVSAGDSQKPTDNVCGILCAIFSADGGKLAVTTAPANYEADGIHAYEEFYAGNADIEVIAGDADHFSSAIRVNTGDYCQGGGNVRAVAGIGAMNSYGIEVGDGCILVGCGENGSLIAKGSSAAFSSAPILNGKAVAAVGKYSAAVLSDWNGKTPLSDYEQVRLTASAPVWGDADGDRSVGSSDVLRLRKYFAGFNYDTGTSPVALAPFADANGDGSLSTADLLLLRQYLANYNYNTGTSTVVLGPQG